MELRWPLISSLAALAAGIFVAALVLAFCGEDGEEPTVRTTPVATRTVTGTPRAGTGTPEGTPSVLTPSVGTATPSGGEPPSEETLEVPPPPPPPPPPEETAPPGQTVPPGPGPTLAPGETPSPPSPTQPAGTPSPAPPTSTPRPTSTPTPPPVLPDLVLVDMFVYRNQVGVVLYNNGEGELLAGQELEFQVRGVLAEPVTLSQDLLPGTTVSIVLEGQLIYRRELVLAVVDPNNLIPEEDEEGETNNGFSKELLPDQPPDLAIIGVAVVGPGRNLAVDIANTTLAPIRGAEIKISVLDCDTASARTAMDTQIDLTPLESKRIQLFPPIIVLEGVCVRITLDVKNIPDADPSNNDRSFVAP